MGAASGLGVCALILIMLESAPVLREADSLGAVPVMECRSEVVAKTRGHKGHGRGQPRRWRETR